MKDKATIIAYKNAPVTEAIIDLQFHIVEGRVASKLQNIFEAIKEKYPQKEEVTLGSSNVIINNGGANTSIKPHKYFLSRYISKDSKFIFQCREDGFTVSMLTPYTKWEDLLFEMKDLWEKFYKIAGFPELSRVAVRYINRLNIPLPFDDFKEYLKNPPNLDPNLPQRPNNFFMQFIIPLEEINGIVVLTQTMAPPLKDNSVSIILDIDVSTKVNLPKNSEELWGLLENMRKQKNLVFKSCITKKTEELFN
jgi:uncharacterized protein (TIGR04255 family)